MLFCLLTCQHRMATLHVGSVCRKFYSWYLEIWAWQIFLCCWKSNSTQPRGPRTLHTKLQKCSYLPCTLQLFFTTATVLYILTTTIFTKIFLKKSSIYKTVEKIVAVVKRVVVCMEDHCFFAARVVVCEGFYNMIISNQYFQIECSGHNGMLYFPHHRGDRQFQWWSKTWLWANEADRIFLLIYSVNGVYTYMNIIFIYFSHCYQHSNDLVHVCFSCIQIWIRWGC